MMLERMDFRYERDRFWAGPSNGITSGRLPSQQFREHVYCTFMRDHTAVRNRDYIGLDNIMWGSDYPHQDSSFPNSVRIVSEHFAGRAAGRPAQNRPAQRNRTLQFTACAVRVAHLKRSREIRLRKVRQMPPLIQIRIG